MVQALKKVISEFGLTDSKKVAVVDKVTLRRLKMIANLEEQREAAQAMIEGKEYYGEKMVWKTNEDGERVRVKAQKSVKHWFYTNDGDTWYFELRYGNKPVPLSKGKSTIVAGAKERLVELIDILIQSANDKDLDAVITAAVNTRVKTSKSAKAH